MAAWRAFGAPIIAPDAPESAMSWPESSRVTMNSFARPGLSLLETSSVSFLPPENWKVLTSTMGSRGRPNGENCASHSLSYACSLQSAPNSPLSEFISRLLFASSEPAQVGPDLW